MNTDPNTGWEGELGHLQVGLLGIGDVPCSDDRVPARRVQAFQSVVILQRVYACTVTILLLLPAQKSKYKVTGQPDDGLREATILLVNGSVLN
jgi:hypothetical protein